MAGLLSNAFWIYSVYMCTVYLHKIFEHLNSLSCYSRTSMARTSLGPWKFVRDMGSSSH